MESLVFQGFESSLSLSEKFMAVISSIALDEIHLADVFRTPFCWGELLEGIVTILEVSFIFSQIDDLHECLEQNFSDMNELSLFIWKTSLLHLSDVPLGSLTELQKSKFLHKWAVCVHVTMRIYLSIDFIPMPDDRTENRVISFNIAPSDTFKYQIDMRIETCRFHNISNEVEEFYYLWVSNCWDEGCFMDYSLPYIGEMSAGSF